MAVSQELSPLQWHLVKLALAARAEGTDSEAELAEYWHSVGAQEVSTPSALVCSVGQMKAHPHSLSP